MTEPVKDIDAGSLCGANDFRDAIAAKCEPVILRGLCANWPVTKAAAESREALASYLASRDSGVQSQAFIGSPAIAGRYYYSDDLSGFNFERADMPLSAALSRMTAAARGPALSSVYFGSIPADDHVNGFSGENHLEIVPPEVQPRLWLGNASFVSAHYDTFDNAACVVAGSRRFTLYRPEAISNLYPGPIDFTMAGPPVGLAVGSEAGDPRYPRFEAVRDQALVAELQPGDALYLPKLWWHQVEATDSLNMLVNYWWDEFPAGPDAPYTAMMLAMIAIAERPIGEREAWRAFFDHYVFRPQGHPLAHLPVERHGILGPLKQNYGRIRARVMQTLRSS